MTGYRTYCLTPHISGHPDPMHGIVEVENCGYDWRYQRGAPVSLESLGKDGWRLAHVLKVGGDKEGYVGIFERTEITKETPCESNH